MAADIINDNLIRLLLNKTEEPSAKVVLDILAKAKLKKGLSLLEVGYLANLKDKRLLKKLFLTAGKIKDEIYGERLVFFAPIYVSNFCINDCDYCNFHTRNTELVRKRLNLKEVRQQVKYLINMGHKRVLIEFGEDPVVNDIDYVTRVIKEIYSVKTAKGNIRRINVNIAATNLRSYQQLKKAKIGTYQLFQETYHRKTYERIHRGPKADYDRQINAYNRAFEAGLDDVGLGVLFGLYDWRFEVLSLVAHSQYLERKYKIGPHTISVPRINPASTVDMDLPYRVSDADFLKLIAILRLAVPYTGMIISTREKKDIRNRAFKIGISQASAASSTSVGGYGKKPDNSQFQVQDERSLSQVITDALKEGFLPSFCTACYRLGRTGEHFMDISKPGEIHNFCRPNGLLTFAEYLKNFADKRLYVKGQGLIKFYLDKIEDPLMREKTRKKLEKIEQGKRDLYF